MLYRNNRLYRSDDEVGDGETPSQAPRGLAGRRLWRRGIVTATALAAALPCPAAAQEAAGTEPVAEAGRIDASTDGSDRRRPIEDMGQVPVADREHPGYEPIGIRLGSVMFYPQLLSRLRYDSNVYARSSDPQSDMVAVLSPEATFEYERPDISWTAELGADVYQYNEVTGENRVDAHAGFDIRKDLGNSIEVRGKLGAARRHVMRGDADAPTDAAEPVPFTDLEAAAFITKTFSRFGVTGGLEARSLAYEDVTSVSGTPLHQSYRDGEIITGSAVPFYEVSDDLRLFGRFGRVSRDYEGFGPRNRDAEGTIARVGAAAQITSLFSTTAEIGVDRLEFDNPAIETSEAVTFDAEAVWLVTPLVTASFTANRSFAETASLSYDARLDTSVGARLDYELRRNLVLSAGAGFTGQDFLGIDRDDEVVDVTLGAEYRLNRALRLGLEGSYETRDSSDPDNSFDRYMVSFNVTARY